VLDTNSPFPKSWPFDDKRDELIRRLIDLELDVDVRKSCGPIPGDDFVANRAGVIHQLLCLSRCHLHVDIRQYRSLHLLGIERLNAANLKSARILVTIEVRFLRERAY